MRGDKTSIEIISITNMHQRKRTRSRAVDEHRVDEWTYVVIGGGIAGISCIQELSASSDDPILLISSSHILKEVKLNPAMSIFARINEVIEYLKYSGCGSDGSNKIC